MQLVEGSCLPKRQLAEVCLMAGDMRDSLGLRSDAHKLWSQGLTLAEQECQALGLKERQVDTLSSTATPVHTTHACFHPHHCALVCRDTLLHSSNVCLDLMGDAPPALYVT